MNRYRYHNPKNTYRSFNFFLYNLGYDLIQITRFIVSFITCMLKLILHIIQLVVFIGGADETRNELQSLYEKVCVVEQLQELNVPIQQEIIGVSKTGLNLRQQLQLFLCTISNFKLYILFFGSELFQLYSSIFPGKAFCPVSIGFQHSSFM